MVDTCWILLEAGLEEGAEPGGGATAETVAVEGAGCWDFGGTYVPVVVTRPLLDCNKTISHFGPSHVQTCDLTDM